MAISDDRRKPYNHLLYDPVCKEDNMNGEIKRLDDRFAIYPLGLVLFGAVLWLILSVGTSGQPSLSTQTIVAAATPSNLSAEIYRNLRSPLGVLLLQILVIIVLTRCCAKVMRKFSQP